jgi:hypothetical protein
MKTIIEMAREAGFAERDAMFRVAFVANKNNLERFAALARADEREACAKVCESYLSESPHSWGGTTMAAAIRARSAND